MHSQIFVSPYAAVITPEDAEAEKARGSSATKVASTQKGVGASQARKVLRQGPNLGKYLDRTGKKVGFQCKPVCLNTEMMGGASVMVGGAAGVQPVTQCRRVLPLLHQPRLHPAARNERRRYPSALLAQKHGDPAHLPDPCR